MVPQDVLQRRRAIVLAQRLVVQQQGGHSPAGQLQNAAVSRLLHLALVHHPGEYPLPPVLGPKPGPLPRLRPAARLPGAAHPKAVAGRPGGILHPPGRGLGQQPLPPGCVRHIASHPALTSSPTWMRLGFLIWGFMAMSLTRDRSYFFAMAHKLSPFTTR